MTSLIFVLYFVAMALAWAGRRNAAMIAFAVSLVVSVAWLKHHMTNPLNLGF